MKDRNVLVCVSNTNSMCFRSRFLHVWNLENKRLLHVIQLPARVRLVRQLEFLNNSFDGGASQVTTEKWHLILLSEKKKNSYFI